MFKKLSKNQKIALVVGKFCALIHLFWLLLVLLGIGQTYLDWIFPLHLIANPYTVMSFNLFNAVLLVITAFIGGYLATLLFFALWKWMKIK
jgi:hypothetical protein